MRLRLLHTIFLGLFFTTIATYSQCWTKIGGGAVQSFAISTNNNLWTWGQNGGFFPGDAPISGTNTPVKIGTDTWRQVSCGTSHRIGIKTNGTLWAWGNNTYGQLGDGTTNDRYSPVQIGALNTWKQVSVFGVYSIALKTDGTLWAWGNNSNSQLGDGTNINRSSPIQIGTDTGWNKISAGAGHAIAVKNNGTLWTWGTNGNGELGNGSTISINYPIQVGTGTAWSQIAAGFSNTFAIKTDGTLWAWGINQYGNLGDGTTTNRSSPVQIGTDTNWSIISPGYNHTLGLKTNKTLWSWGRNDQGQLGNNTTTNSTIPIQIGANTWDQIATGFKHSIGLDTNGYVWSWGSNSIGQLGGGSNPQLSPNRLIKQELGIIVNGGNDVAETTNICDPSGDTGMQLYVIGSTGGAIVWDYGTTNGSWTNDWLVSADAPSCCFLKNTDSNSTIKDKIRWRITEDGCTLTSPTYYIKNNYNEPPTSLTVSNSIFCSANAPSNIVLTANFPNFVNKNGTVRFYSNFCGGPIVGSNRAGNNSSTVAVVVATPAVTTTYYARYEPDDDTVCDSQNCSAVTVIVNPVPTLGTVSTAGPINFCNASGNFTTPVTVSGQTGTVSWEYGSNNGSWNSWSGYTTSSGVNTFGKKNSNNDTSPDRIRYKVTNCSNTTTSPAILIQNNYNEAPTSLAVNTQAYCANAAPSTITLTATFPSYVNMNGKIKFYRSTCGGTLLSTQNVGEYATTFTYTLAAPTTTTNYFVRYEPNSGTSCSNSACAGAVVNVVTTPTPTTTIVNETCFNVADGKITLLTPENALVFKNSDSDYVDLGVAYLSNRTAFTVEGWIKYNSADLAGKSRISLFGQNDVVEFGFVDDQSMFLYTPSGGSVQVAIPANLGNNAWHHVAGVGNGTNVIIYIDGANIAAGGFTTGNYGTSTAFNATIGAQVIDNTGGGFTGQMRKVGFYSTALSAANIATLFSNFNTLYSGSELGLLAGYNFVEGSGTTLTKLPAGTNGTFVNTPQWNYSYAWTKTGTPGFTAATRNIIGLSAGTYNLNLSTTGVGCPTATNFVVGGSPAPTLGTVNASGTINFCDVFGNYGPIITVSGQTGTVVWNYGTTDGGWSGNWSPDNCCFLKNTSPSSTIADKIRYKVTNGTCSEIISPVIFIKNNYNEAPTSLTVSNASYCVNVVPANLILTATFPTAINRNGIVRFYTGSCGGTLLGSTIAVANSTTVTLNITAPSTTTTYFARYEPSTGSGCANSICVTTIVIVNQIMTASAASATPTVCINSAITNITHSTTNATGIGTATGLPSGLTASFASNIITISGTPTVVGTFNYSVPLLGNTCGAVNATGTITVNLNSSLPTFTQVAPICSGAALSALPTTSLNGVTGTWSPAVNNLATTTYTFTPTNAECTSTATMTIVVNSNIIYVNNALSTGNNDGSSWNNAFFGNDALQKGIDYVNANTCTTQIWVAKGTYKPTKNPETGTTNIADRDNTFNMPNGKAIYGGFVGNEVLLSARNWGANPTILSGDIGTIGTATDNVYHVIVSVLDNANTVLDGFTVLDGYTIPTNTSDYLLIEGRALYKSKGGGMHNYNSSVTITNCIFTRNNAFTGGGIHNNNSVSATITNCIFSNNTALGGAGVYNQNYSSPTITNCVFNNNYAVQNGSAIRNLTNSNPNVINCIIWGNTSGDTQGIRNDSNATAIVSYSNVQGASIYEGSGNINTDPLFADSTDPDGPDNIWMTDDDGLQLQSTSPSKDSGTNTGAPALDILGNAIYNTTKDMGTYEYFDITNCSISTTWAGSSWSNGSPTISKAAIFSSNFTSTASIRACSVTVNNAAVVTIDSNHVLTVGNTINTTAGSLIFNNNASLIQNSNVANTTPITYKRNSTLMRAYDYSYWSSPVASQNLYDFSPGTMSDKYFYWNTNPTSYYWSVIMNGVATMTVGQGYIVRSPLAVGAAPAIFNGTFFGNPNNGNITIPVIVSSPTTTYNLNLLGNPYPSGLSADLFITANQSIINGTLYFWSHNTPITALNYTSNDYASYNLTGGAGTGAVALNLGSGSIGNNAIPNGNIAAGQAFFVEGKIVGASNASFTNAMRTTANSNFYRSASAVSSLEKNRIWLELSNNQGAFSQMLYGNIEGATNDKDQLYDGLLFDDTPTASLYSMLNDERLTIKGNGLPFTETDINPLGYISKIADDYSIKLALFDGLFESQNIYLEDKLLNIIHDLKQSDYSFATNNGTFNDRFVLRFNNNTLANSSFETNDNSLIVSKKNQNININSSNIDLQEVQIFDVRGRLLAENKNINNKKSSFDDLNIAQQLLIIKIKTIDNKIVSKKIVF